MREWLQIMECIFLFRCCTSTKMVKCLLQGHPYHSLWHLSFLQKSSPLPSCPHSCQIQIRDQSDETTDMYKEKELESGKQKMALKIKIKNLFTGLYKNFSLKPHGLSLISTSWANKVHWESFSRHFILFTVLPKQLWFWVMKTFFSSVLSRSYCGVATWLATGPF